jgi:hypothetical protein
MLAVLAHVGPPWPSVERWSRLLPAWFVEGCAPERDQDEAEQWLAWWRTLPADEQARVSSEQRWSLADWLYWLEPSERQWFWWDAAVEDSTRLRVMVEVSGLPAPLGALLWLLRASGAGTIAEDPMV